MNHILAGIHFSQELLQVNTHKNCNRQQVQRNEPDKDLDGQAFARIAASPERFPLVAKKDSHHI